jgi:hypothetical protein
MVELPKFNAGYLFVAILAIVLMRDAWVNASQVKLNPYSEFLQPAKNAEIAGITISINVIKGKLVKPALDGRPRMMSIGESNQKVYGETATKVKFADVAGFDETKDELREIANLFKEPWRHGRLGGRRPEGVLVGPPGTGKTLHARVVASEIGVPFFSISGFKIVEIFVGVGAARVHDLFEQARKKVPLNGDPLAGEWSELPDTPNLL